MDIRMRQAEALYLERLAREAETDGSLEDFAGMEIFSETENHTKAAEKPGQALPQTGAETSPKVPRTSKPSCDKFVPEKQEDLQSFGCYHPVSDGKGGVQIRFDAPVEEPASPEKDRGADK